MHGTYIKLLQIKLGQAVKKEFTTGFSLQYFICIIYFNGSGIRYATIDLLQNFQNIFRLKRKLANLKYRLKIFNSFRFIISMLNAGCRLMLI